MPVRSGGTYTIADPKKPAVIELTEPPTKPDQGKDGKRTGAAEPASPAPAAKLEA